MTTQSARCFAAAQQLLVGGVNSPVRAYKAVGGIPPFIRRGAGAYLWDVDERRYIDYVCSWGAMILGHAAPSIVAAVQQAAGDGLSFGAPTERETELAQLIQRAMPMLERIRFVCSGTEATMSAIRLARAATRRDKILKFAGCYHGHADYLLVKAGSGALTCGEPDSAGVPADFARHTLVAEYNDVAGVRSLFKQYPREVAAVIVEPVVGNMGCVPPREGFLSALRSLCDEFGALLICDEVMTGFRVALGGAQQVYGVRPDLTCLGKVIGGGLPVGAYGGSADLMDRVAPLGPVYQAGTLAGNPLAMAAGIAALQGLHAPGAFATLQQRAQQIADGLAAVCRELHIPCQTTSVGGMWGFFFTDQPVYSLADTVRCDTARFRRFFHAMLAAGINLAPSPFEASFVSLAHSTEDIQQTLEAARAALQVTTSN